MDPPHEAGDDGFEERVGHTEPVSPALRRDLVTASL